MCCFFMMAKVTKPERKAVRRYNAAVRAFASLHDQTREQQYILHPVFILTRRMILFTGQRTSFSRSQHLQ